MSKTVQACYHKDCKAEIPLLTRYRPVPGTNGEQYEEILVLDVETLRAHLLAAHGRQR